jgi:hypothetical protein
LLAAGAPRSIVFCVTFFLFFLGLILFSVTPYRGVAFNNRVFCGNIEGPVCTAEASTDEVAVDGIPMGRRPAANDGFGLDHRAANDGFGRP